MKATFTTKLPKNRITTKKNPSKSHHLSQKYLTRFRNTFYQVLCDHDPNLILEEKQDFLEYLAGKIWELNLLQQFIPSTRVKNKIDDEYFTLLNEQEIINKINEMMQNDFITFEFCENDRECIEISTSILSKWKPCHSACHKMISHKQMAYEYNTVVKLLEHEGVSKFVNWASKQKSYSKDHVIQKLRYSK
ncbi:16990_t:CDS:2 [Funneliformis geosporum]|uniref:16570_t:CDS:1 n=1 Tax=Funneliformis geosporum TaxID=1117311 RepID=A0A9W4SCI8_9GLOM|nr:16570_t:CDS:2 [Funneliformis geosporum]CAI2164268.1 16990_t:CDS:2 [Funneliformis geosporum]